MPDGTEPTTPPEVPSDLSLYTDEALRAMRTDLETAYAERRPGLSPSSSLAEVAAVQEMRSQATRITETLTARAESLQTISDLPESLVTPVEPDPEPTPEPEPVAPEAVAPALAPVVDIPAPVAVDMPLSVAASLTLTDITGNREPGTPPPAETRSRVAAMMAVAPGSALAGAGTRIALGDEVDFDLFGRMLDDAKNMREPGKAILASVSAFEMDTQAGRSSQALHTGLGIYETDALIAETVDAWRARNASLFPERALRNPEQFSPRVAAICDPLDIIREIPNCTQSTEPFSDSLPGRPAGRLGFQYTPSMTLSDLTSGVADWDEADQALVDPDDPETWKPCVLVACPSPLSIRAEAIAACMYFDVSTDMSNPERIANAMQTITAVKARLKTARLLQIADTFSHHYSSSAGYGALPAFVQAVLTILPQGEYPERLDESPYLIYTPPGLLEALVIDRANQAYNVTAGERRDVIAYIENEAAAAGWNVRVIDLQDVALGTNAPFPALNAVGAANETVLPGLGGGGNGEFVVRLIAPEAALYFSTGEINTGIQRSPELMRRNQAQWFMEEWVGLAKHGCHPWYTLHLDLCDNGGRAGLETLFACPNTVT